MAAWKRFILSLDVFERRWLDLLRRRDVTVGARVLPGSETGTGLPNLVLMTFVGIANLSRLTFRKAEPWNSSSYFLFFL